MAIRLYQWHFDRPDPLPSLREQYPVGATVQIGGETCTVTGYWHLDPQHVDIGLVVVDEAGEEKNVSRYEL